MIINRTRQRSGYRQNLISYMHLASFKNECGQTSVAANRVVATRSELLFHTTAGRAVTRTFQKNPADAKSSTFQGDKVYAACDEIST